MRELEPGHVYELASYDGEQPNVLRFMKRVGAGYPGNCAPPFAGTNCQEVIRALIARVEYLNGQVRHVNNDKILNHLRNALQLFELRAAERRGRSPLPLRLLYKIERLPTCKTCGHVGCEGEHYKG